MSSVISITLMTSSRLTSAIGDSRRWPIVGGRSAASLPRCRSSARSFPPLRFLFLVAGFAPVSLSAPFSLSSTSRAASSSRFFAASTFGNPSSDGLQSAR